MKYHSARRTGHFKNRSQLAKFCEKEYTQGLTQEEIAERSGVSLATVSRILAKEKARKRAILVAEVDRRLKLITSQPHDSKS